MKRLLFIALTLVLILPVIAVGQIANIVVTSAASFQPGLPPKGSIGALFCTGLKVSGTVAAVGTRLPTMLAGITVTVNGVLAPLFAVSDLGGYQQINFQVPVPFSPLNPAPLELTISQNGVIGTATVQGIRAAPGDFFRNGSTQFGVFQHASDYALVTSDNPARAGETIIGYATGLPPAEPSVSMGEPAPDLPLSYVPQVAGNREVDRVGVLIGDILLLDPVPVSRNTTGQLPIPFMGLAPGLVGVYQINFVLPEGLGSGNVPVRLGRDLCVGITFCRPDFIYSQPVLLAVR